MASMILYNLLNVHLEYWRYIQFGFWNLDFGFKNKPAAKHLAFNISNPQSKF